MSVQLTIPPEPAELRVQLRDAVLDGADWSGRFGNELGLGDVLWGAWGSQLEAAGLDRSVFASVIGGYRRELWFWLLGDRLWSQVATGLAGRLQRRVPASSSS